MKTTLAIELDAKLAERIKDDAGYVGLTLDQFFECAAKAELDKIGAECDHANGEDLTVELHPAFSWDCNECGAGNFARSVRFEGSPEELEELRQEHGVESWEAGEFQTAPEHVTCAKCGKIFDAVDDRSPEADE